MSKKEVTKKETELVESNLSPNSLQQLEGYDLAAFDGVDLDVEQDKELFSNDILIPKLWLIQTMSDLSKQRKAMDGDYCDSRSEEVLLSVDGEYLPLIVMKTFKRWQTFKIVGDKKEFVSSEIMTLENAGLKYQETIEGDELRRRQVISAYVLLGDDAKKGIVKPYIIDFASTSKGAGRNLVSDISVLNTPKKDPITGEKVRAGLPSWVGWFKLGSKEETIDKDDFYVKTIKFGGYLPKDMFPFLRSAYDEIKRLIDSNSIEIDDRDLHDAAKPTTAETGKVNPDAATEAGV